LIRYYNTKAASFELVTQCSTAFLRPGSTEFLSAYEFSSFTATSNRLCSICSTCPSEYHTDPCTSTSNTRCTLEFRLRVGEILAIVLSIILVLLVCAFVALSLFVGKAKQKRELGQTKNHLELTERLLGDEREEKHRMGQAWEIGTNDLTFQEEIGAGANGVVYRGIWG
jgi:hypothetical protein